MWSWWAGLIASRPAAAGRGAVIQLYMRGQARGFAPVCEGCRLRSSCEGVVLAELESRGAQGLEPS